MIKLSLGNLFAIKGTQTCCCGVVGYTSLCLNLYSVYTRWVQSVSESGLTIIRTCWPSLPVHPLHYHGTCDIVNYVYKLWRCFSGILGLWKTIFGSEILLSGNLWSKVSEDWLKHQHSIVQIVVGVANIIMHNQQTSAFGRRIGSINELHWFHPMQDLNTFLAEVL